jgi:hypothetical protein
VGGHGLVVAAGHRHDVNRRLDHRTAGDEDRHAVIEMRRVERRERVRIDAEHLAEMLLQTVGAVAGAVPQAGDAHAFWQRAQIRQPRCELAVDDRQPHRTGHGHARDERRRLRKRSLREREPGFRDRRHVRKAPVFELRIREADLREPFRGDLAPLPHPRGRLHERFHHRLAPAAVCPA